MKGDMMRSLLAAAALLFVTSCVDQVDTSEPSETQASQAVTTDLTTRPWTPRLAPTYIYWPTDAIRVQVLEINGDIDANGNEYAYAYMVKNGATIYQLFRLLKSDLPSLNSTIGNVAQAKGSQNPTTSLMNSAAGLATGGPHSPPQPGGNGGVVLRAWFNQVILDQAAGMNQVMTVITNNMNTVNYRENLTSPPVATHGIAAP